MLMAMIIAGMPMKTFGSHDSILQQLWNNDLTVCANKAGCAEIAMGMYYRDGAKKPFILLRQSSHGDEGTGKTSVHLNFTNPRGDKYVIVSRFLRDFENVETRQIALLPDIDPARPRIVAPSMYEELRETNLNPLFLTLSLHLVKKYSIKIQHSEEVQVHAEEEARLVLPHEIYVRVEKRDGHTAPVEVQMYRDEKVICTIRMKNAMANGQLRPFWISIASRGKRDEIFIDSWGVVPDDPTNFTPTGLGRGELSIPEISAKVPCPVEICKK